MPAPNINKLYDKLTDIKDGLTKIVTLTNDVIKEASNYQGEISRVVVGQMEQFFLPNISKYVDDANTPGSIEPIITFLDSIPLSMVRPNITSESQSKAQQIYNLLREAGLDNVQIANIASAAKMKIANGKDEAQAIKEVIEEYSTKGVTLNDKDVKDAMTSIDKAMTDPNNLEKMDLKAESLKLANRSIGLGLGLAESKKKQAIIEKVDFSNKGLRVGDTVSVKPECREELGSFIGKVSDKRGNSVSVVGKQGQMKTFDSSKLRCLKSAGTNGRLAKKPKDLKERDMEIFKGADDKWGKKLVGPEKGPQSDAMDQKKISAVINYINANVANPTMAAIKKGLEADDASSTDFVSKRNAAGEGYGQVIITTDDNGSQYVADFSADGNVLSIKKVK